MNVLNKCKNELLLAGVDDWIDASELVSIIIEITGKVEKQENVKEIALEVVQQVLQEKLMKVGKLVTAENNILRFSPWKISDSEAVKKIKSEWDSLGRYPNLGELFWLCNTEKGDIIGSTLSS